jgi:hypothetical protein
MIEQWFGTGRRRILPKPSQGLLSGSRFDLPFIEGFSLPPWSETDLVCFRRRSPSAIGGKTISLVLTKAIAHFSAVRQMEKQFLHFVQVYLYPRNYSPEPRPLWRQVPVQCFSPIADCSKPKKPGSLSSPFLLFLGNLLALGFGLTTF